MNLLMLFSLAAVSVSAATLGAAPTTPQLQQPLTPPSPTRSLNPPVSYPITSTFTSKSSFRLPPFGPFPGNLPVPTFTWVEQDITTLEPHPSRPTTYPETVIQTAITTATHTVYEYPEITIGFGLSYPPGTTSTSFTTTETTTRFDTYHIHTPAASHMHPGLMFQEFPGCGDCVLDADWVPDQECEAKEWGTGCGNQQCQWRENEGDFGLWYCFAGPYRGDKDYAGRLCWKGDDIYRFDAIAKPCLYGDQLPHCVPCVGGGIKCEKGDGACRTRPAVVTDLVKTRTEGVRWVTRKAWL